MNLIVDTSMMSAAKLKRGASGRPWGEGGEKAKKKKLKKKKAKTAEL